MTNHIHALIYFSATDKPINKIIGDGKRFIAYEIIRRLNEQGRKDIILQLQNAVENKNRTREGIGLSSSLTERYQAVEYFLYFGFLIGFSCHRLKFFKRPTIARP